MRFGRALIAAPVLAGVLLVVAVGPASATGGDDPPVLVSADEPGSLGVVRTAQSEVEINPETERRLVGRESSERVDSVVIALWSIAAGMTVMLVVFLWHTSPRRRLRLARRRSTELYEAEQKPPEDAAATESSEEGTVEVPEAVEAEAAEEEVPETAETETAEIPEAVEAEVAQEVTEAAEAEVAEEVPEAEDAPEAVEVAASEDAPEAVEDAASEDAPEVVEAAAGGPDAASDAAAAEEPVPEAVLPPAEEEPEMAPDLPPVWEDEAEQAGEEAEPGPESRTDGPPRAGAAARESASRFWLRLRHTLGLD